MDGVVLIDKPAGQSSHSTVQAVRRALGWRGRRGVRAGHAGTLDPFATGLLLVLTGGATRLMPHVVGHDKRYLLEVSFGASSSTDDSAGDLTIDPGATMPTRAAVEAALGELARTTEQVPPAVSAIHIDGERAYRRVRRGEHVTVPPRTVAFHSIELVEWDDAPGDGGVVGRVSLDVACSAGTYMRALARDLGELVGCSAHASALRRTRVGPWRIEDAVELDHVGLGDVRDPLELLAGLDRVVLDAAGVADVVHGRSIAAAHRPASEVGDDAHVDDDADVDLALVDSDGALVAIARRDTAAGVVRPHTVLRAPVPAAVGGSVAGSSSALHGVAP